MIPFFAICTLYHFASFLSAAFTKYIDALSIFHFASSLYSLAWELIDATFLKTFKLMFALPAVSTRELVMHYVVKDLRVGYVIFPSIIRSHHKKVKIVKGFGNTYIEDYTMP